MEDAIMVEQFSLMVLFLALGSESDRTFTNHWLQPLPANPTAMPALNIQSIFHSISLSFFVNALTPPLRELHAGDT
jgi:hypothetical protein